MPTVRPIAIRRTPAHLAPGRRATFRPSAATTRLSTRTGAVLRIAQTILARTKSPIAGWDAAPHSRERRHLQRLRRPGAAPPGPGNSTHPAAHLVAESLQLETGPHTACPPPRTDPHRSLRPATAAPRRLASRGTRLPEPRLLRPCHNIKCPAIGSCISTRRNLGRGHDGQWRVLGRPHPGSLRRRLRARKPHRHDPPHCRRRSAIAG